ncbi:TSR2 protein, partial [Amia calva]|nr:TSR2 protein [Amia calva]
MVDVVQQYFHDNADLQPCEVEDFLAELMNNEFDTVVDDGSLSQVALQLSGFFEQCERGQLAEVRARITQLSQRKGTARVTAVPAKSPGQEEEEDSSSEEEEEAEAMECEVGAAAGVSTQTHTLPEDNAPAPETEDGWTVVRKKK